MQVIIKCYTLENARKIINLAYGAGFKWGISSREDIYWTDAPKYYFLDDENMRISHTDGDNKSFVNNCIKEDGAFLIEDCDFINTMEG